MTSRRMLKLAEAVRQVVSSAILTEVRDPRVREVTVTRVEVSSDLRYAKVFVSVMGDAAREKLSLRGLESAAGYLQAQIASRIETRYTPRLQFQIDKGVKHSLEVARILGEVLPPQTAGDVENEGDEDHVPEAAAEDLPAATDDDVNNDLADGDDRRGA